MHRLLTLVPLLPMLAGSAMAALMVTADPSTSAAWPVGTSFEPGEVSATTDPLGPFSGTPIQFRGWQNGGSQVSMNGNPCSNSNACLVFLYDLNFSTPTEITSITFTGDAFNGATFQLLNPSHTVLDSLSVSSGNVGHDVSYTLAPNATGTSFLLALYDTSSTWTFVNSISGTSVPEPSTTVLVSLALIGFVWGLRTRTSRG